MADPADDEPEHDWHRRHIWQIQPVRDLLVIGCIVVLLYLGYVLSAVTVPLLIALGLAYLFEPVIARLTRGTRVVTRVRVVIATLVLLVGAAVLAIALVVPFAFSQAKNLMGNAGVYAQRAVELSDQPWVPDAIGEGARSLRDALGGPPDADPEASGEAEEQGEGRGEAGGGAADAAADRLDEDRVRLIVIEEMRRHEERRAGAEGGGLVDLLGRGASRALQILAGIFGSLFSVAMSIFLVGFFFFYFSTTFPHVRDTARAYLPTRHRTRILELLGEMDQVINGFVRGRLTIAFILAVVYAVGWSLCGVPSAVLLGVGTGVASLVPYLSAVGLPLAWILLIVHLYGAEQASIYLRDDGSIVWWLALLLPAIVNVIAQILDDYVLSPIIQGKATNLNPVAIVVAVIAGGVLAGLYGMLLAIPVAACIKILYSEVVKPRIQAWLDGRREDPLPLDR